VTSYYLDLGSTPGGNDLYSASQGTNQTVQVSGLPQSGTIYITLYSLIGGTYYNTQTSTAAGP
jgi:serine protease